MPDLAGLVARRNGDSSSTSDASTSQPSLPFPPITRQHIMNCAVHSWHPHYRTLTPKTRLVPLSEAFVSYLRADGIILPPEEQDGASDDRFEKGSDSDEDDEDAGDPSAAWSEIHQAVKNTISSLGGHVYPKLNWSAPKDATWISATNSMDCTTANDVYLLLKSSDLVAYDLDLALNSCLKDDAEPGASSGATLSSPTYQLVLRKAIPNMLNSMEFRCFVRNRKLLGLCQRDLNHYDFMAAMGPTIVRLIFNFFDEHIRQTFPDENFAFDVYVPSVREGARVWLIDFNPWALCTDPLLFSWLELLTMPEPETMTDDGTHAITASMQGASLQASDEETEAIEGNVVTTLPYLPELRLIRRGDPECYTFNTPLYSAHKLPIEVVDASQGGQGGMREFLERWELTQAQRGSPQADSDDK